MERVLFIYNPNAGKATMRNKLSEVIEIFRKNDFYVTVYPTLEPGDATKCVMDNGMDYDRIICSGGVTR